jgi:hypothetical protein
MAIVDRIKVSIEGYGIWGSMEASISPEENPIDEWIKLKELVQLAMNQSDSMKGTVVTQVDRLNGKEDLVSHINSCKEIKVLETYKILVKGKPDLQELYDKKFAELTG